MRLFPSSGNGIEKEKVIFFKKAKVTANSFIPIYHLISLTELSTDSSETCVHFSGRRSEDETDDGVARDFDVRERAEDVDVSG